jgi:hypothetical protein
MYLKDVAGAGIGTGLDGQLHVLPKISWYCFRQLKLTFQQKSVLLQLFNKIHATISMDASKDE